MICNRSLAATVALSLTAVLSACGSSEAVSSTKSSATTSAAGDAAQKVAVGDEVDLAVLSQDVTAAMREKKTFTFEGDIGGEWLAGQAQIKGMATDTRIDTHIEGEATTLLFVDGVMYLSGMTDLPAGKKYVKVDPEGDDPMSRAMTPFLSQMAQSASPMAGLGQLAGVQAKAVAVTDGAATYEVTLTAEEQLTLAKKRLEQMRLGGQELLALTESLTPITLRQTVRSDNIPTQVEIVGSETESLTLLYSGWGEPIDVAVPPADEVALPSDIL